jgi:predicted nucleic acid-binding protein
MPEGHRIAPAVVLEALERGFAQPWLALEAADHLDALQRAVKAGIRGGALYDALIAATVSKHDAELLSADRRAHGAYQAMSVEATFIVVD